MLCLKSIYSLRYGTAGIEELTDLMVAHGYRTAVLTDINNSTGAIEFVRSCRAKGLNGLVGMEFRNGDALLYTAIARNHEGFREINEHMSSANQRHMPVSSLPPDFKNVFVLYPFGSVEPNALREHEYIGIHAREVNKIIVGPKDHQEHYVIWHPISLKHSEDYQLHKRLRAISHNILISQLQPGQYSQQPETFVTRGWLLDRFQQFPTIIANTKDLLDQCGFEFDFSSVKNKATFTGNDIDDRLLLSKYAKEGFEKRYTKQDSKAWERLLHELRIIDQLRFSAYFLITDDICRYARSRGFNYVGRGSGANSIVAYCLRITEVCPMKLNLYFERFLNPKRATPPDFDIDFAWDERDEIYDYIFKRYQRGHTALLGAMSTFRTRAAVRELGKAYGLPKAEIDSLIRDPHNPMNKNEVSQMIASLHTQLGDFPNLRTIHASGVIISEIPLTYYSALDYPPKGLPTLQFDMYMAESIGFEKFDILSQRGLGHIRDSVGLIRENTGKSVDVHRIQDFFNDPNIAAQLRSSKTVGCFYIESPAMRSLITKLKCDNDLTLTAASSVIRPGVASSGMMQMFIKYHNDPATVVYLHPIMEEILAETYGVMVYQEDVMKIGHLFGGLELDDCDVLRRMMSGKYRDKKHMKQIEAKYYGNCRERGYTPALAKEVWRLMESFAGYSFCKAHSASFVVESYQSLFLKTYYPLEFMVAVLNNYGGFYFRSVYINEAKKAGANVHLPCVNLSGTLVGIQGRDIYLGFECLLKFQKEMALLIPAEREQNGPFTGLHNFIIRTGIALDKLIILIRLGAFRFTGLAKKALLWEAHLLLNQASRKKVPVGLFCAEDSRAPSLPLFDHDILEDLYDEIELMGFPLSGSFFDLVRTTFRGDVPAKDLAKLEGETVRMVGEFVCDKDVKTKTGKYMKFGNFFDANGDFFNTVHFPQSLIKYPLRGVGVYLVLGKVACEYGDASIVVEKIAKLPIKPDPRSV